MARATAHPDHQCISSEDIQGTEVYGAGGKNIGEIDHLIIDKVSGRVAYAVMSFGGFVGLGHSHYPIPWGALTFDTSLGGFRTNITEEQLRDAPEFGPTAPETTRDTGSLIRLKDLPAGPPPYCALD
jgi:sporulation protein YlmC with PRC-barrel domain